MLTRPEAPLAPDDEARFLALVGERARRRPLQHLTGVQTFWRHEFRVSPDVLIPRPETELIVEASLELLREVPSPVAVDVGTGSGCIALSLAAERPDAVVYALDASPAALAVAQENARRMDLEPRVRFRRGDLLTPVADLAGGVDLVASNPPYVGADELVGLAPEVRDHEPRAALVPPDNDRCSIYRRLAAEAVRVLRPGGWLVVEIGQGMSDDVSGICAAAGLAVERVLRDLRGIPRTVVAHYGSRPGCCENLL